MADFADDLANQLGIAPLDGPEVNQLLGTARDIAHGTERKSAPLGSFLIGMAVQQRIAEGAPRDEALTDILASAAAVIPEPLPEEPGQA